MRRRHEILRLYDFKSNPWSHYTISIQSFWCSEYFRDRSRGFARPVFPALGTSARLAALLFVLPPRLPFTVTTLSIYDSAAARGQMSPTWDFSVSFCHCWVWWLVCLCVCRQERERERNRAREGIWEYAREGWRGHSCMYDCGIFFSKSLWGWGGLGTNVPCLMS